MPEPSVVTARNPNLDNGEAARSDEPQAISVLFVCLGNICRSPMAHAVFQHLSASLPSTYPRIIIDSSGTDAYHALDPPDSRTLETLEEHGIHGFDHAARKVLNSDFQDFDYIFAMDRQNLKDLKRRCRKQKRGEELLQRIRLFGDCDREAGDDEVTEIDDPYYGGAEGFETAFDQCLRYSTCWFRDVLNVDVQMAQDGKISVNDLKRPIPDGT